MNRIVLFALVCLMFILDSMGKDNSIHYLYAHGDSIPDYFIKLAFGVEKEGDWEKARKWFWNTYHSMPNSCIQHVFGSDELMELEGWSRKPRNRKLLGSYARLPFAVIWKFLDRDKDLNFSAGPYSFICGYVRMILPEEDRDEWSRKRSYAPEVVYFNSCLFHRLSALRTANYHFYKHIEDAQAIVYSELTSLLDHWPWRWPLTWKTTIQAELVRRYHRPASTLAQWALKDHLAVRLKKSGWLAEVGEVYEGREFLSWLDQYEAAAQKTKDQ